MGKSPSKKDSIQPDASRSVFERLQSPSNLTGIQKKKYQDKKGKRVAATKKKLEKPLEAQSGQGKNKRDNTSGKAADQMLDRSYFWLAEDENILYNGSASEIASCFLDNGDAGGCYVAPSSLEEWPRKLTN
jgi:hypothetical protein